MPINGEQEECMTCHLSREERAEADMQGGGRKVKERIKAAAATTATKERIKGVARAAKYLAELEAAKVMREAEAEAADIRRKADAKAWKEIASALKWDENGCCETLEGLHVRDLPDPATAPLNVWFGVAADGTLTGDVFEAGGGWEEDDGSDYNAHAFARWGKDKDGDECLVQTDQDDTAYVIFAPECHSLPAAQQ